MVLAFSLALGILPLCTAPSGTARAAQPETSQADTTGVITPGNIFSGTRTSAASLPVEVLGMQRDIREKGFSTVYISFATNSAAIMAQSHQQMEHIATLLREEAAWCLNIVGHTDATGEAAYNLELSRKRALSVQQALVDAEIAAHRLAAEGMGDQQPVAENTTREGRARNRRVELRRTPCP